MRIRFMIEVNGSIVSSDAFFYRSSALRRAQELGFKEFRIVTMVEKGEFDEES